MGENQFFISYSRKQLYFAEALSLALQKEELDVWMDLQQLEPGRDWQDQIDEGLRHCSTLILVASKQSIASPYVESEWRAAIDSGKPVYIACYEEVDLPPALQSASLVDFRGSFKKGMDVLVTGLKNMSSVRETVPPPNRLGLPQKMPPMITLVAGLLLIEALFIPLQPLGAGLRIYSVCPWYIPLVTGLGLLMAWQFLHHKSAVGVSRIAFILLGQLIARYLPALSITPTTGIELGPIISCSLVYLTPIIAIFLLERGSFGAEILRWSAPGENAEANALRRRFHKIQPAKDEPARVVRQQVLASRNSERKDIADVEPPRSESMILAAAEETRTYSLHYAAPDSPVAASLRHALSREGMQEVNINAQIHFVILSENLPRSQLKDLLDSGHHLILLLISNIAFQGDALLERAASLQLIDYRERSRQILTALARTVAESPEDNLPVGFETNPQPLNLIAVPPSVRGVALIVSSIGGWLVLSGMVSLTQSLFGAAPTSISSFVLDVSGFVCGLICIDWGKAVTQRATTNIRFVPALLICTWLAVPLYLGSSFVIAEAVATAGSFDSTITLRSLFTHQTYWTCLICPGGFVVVGIATVWRRYLRDWLPAFISTSTQGDRFEPLVSSYAKYWIWLALALGAFGTFGITVGAYILLNIVRSLVTSD